LGGGEGPEGSENLLRNLRLRRLSVLTDRLGFQAHLNYITFNSIHICYISFFCKCNFFF